MNSRWLAGSFALILVASLPARPLMAQGRGPAMSAPHTNAPQGGGRPSTPPGQAKQPPAGAAPKTTPPKTTTPTPLVINPSLGKTLTPLLPPNTDLNTAAAGFRNLG